MPANQKQGPAPLNLSSPFRALILASVALLGLLTNPLEGGDQSSNATGLIEIVLPPQLADTFQANDVGPGQADLLVEISFRGKLQDSLLLAASNPRFGESILATVSEWSFITDDAHHPLSAYIYRVTVAFEKGKVSTHFQSEAAHRSPHPDPSNRAKTDLVAHLDEIDAIPLPLYIDKPSFPESANGRSAGLSAVFDFYIDPHGRVRMPTLSLVDHSKQIAPELIDVALDSLSKWRFQVPLKDGKPVIVRAAQRISFSGAESLSAKVSAK